MDPPAREAAPTAGDAPFITPAPVPVPAELQSVRQHAEAYTEARIRSFAQAFAQQLGSHLTPEQVDYLTAGMLGSNPAALQAPAQAAPPEQQLHLILRHDCMSSGCGDSNCELCRFNPSRMCKQNLKPKYLIDDYLRAKCGASLYVQLVDQQQQQVEQELPNVVLQVHVLNGEKYRELAVNGADMGLEQLSGCIIMAPPGQKPLLKRESSTAPIGPDPRVFLTLQNGQAPLSDLQCTTSSEALLQGKAPTFRLLFWAVDSRTGEPLQAVRAVVSDSFVVATKRVKHAMKNDIPTITDDITKLMNVGKATVDKLKDLDRAARAENVQFDLPPHLLSGVDRVGQFRELVELTEQSNELKQKLRQLLKFSAEKWDELAQHALAAVLPDFRPRVWWCLDIKGGLLFPGKSGGPQLEQQPIAYVHRDAPGSPESVFAVHQLPDLMQLLPALKDRAKQDWFATSHTNWSIYWNDAADPYAKQLQGLAISPNLAVPIPLGVLAAAAMSASGGGAAAAVAATAAAVNRAAQLEEASRGEYAPPPAGAGWEGPSEHQQQQQVYAPHAAHTAVQPEQQQQQEQQPTLMAPPPPRQPRVPAAAAGPAVSAAPVGLSLPQQVDIPMVSLPLPGPGRLPQPALTPSPFAKTNPEQLLARAAVGPAAAGGEPAAAAPHSRSSSGGSADGNSDGSPRSSGGSPRQQQLAGQKRQKDGADNAPPVAAGSFQQQQQQQRLEYLYAADVIAPRSDEIVSPVAAAGGGLSGAPPSLMMLDALNTVDLMQTLGPVELAGLADVSGPAAGLGDAMLMETSVQWQSLQSLPATGDSLEFGPALAAAAAAMQHSSGISAGRGGRDGPFSHPGSSHQQQQGQDLGVEGLSLLLSDSLDLTGVKGQA